MSKVILITGASSGIGKETALKLIKEGHTVYGGARRVEKMKDLVDAGGKSVKLDVTNEKNVVSVVKKIIKEQGKIDVLVNNAGFSIYGPIEETPMAEAKRQFEVNIFGLARITQEVLPHMRKNKSGTIINISSVGGKVYTALGAWYHATKHALEGWSDCLRLEVKDFGIKVVIVEPGLIATEFGEVMFESLKKASAKGPYGDLVNSMIKTTKNYMEKPDAASPPSVIANVISKAISTSEPKTRYAEGKLAKPLLFMRKYFSDKFFDKAIMNEIEKMKKM